MRKKPRAGVRKSLCSPVKLATKLLHTIGLTFPQLKHETKIQCTISTFQLCEQVNFRHFEAYSFFLFSFKSGNSYFHHERISWMKQVFTSMWNIGKAFLLFMSQLFLSVYFKHLFRSLKSSDHGGVSRYISCRSRQL